jgi:hypothetical protein
MMLLLAALAASPAVLDEANCLSAGQRADLDVAGQGRVVVAIADFTSRGALHDRASELTESNPSQAVVVFDRAHGRGLIRLRETDLPLHLADIVGVEEARLNDGDTAPQARLLRAVRFASGVSEERAAEAPRNPGWWEEQLAGGAPALLALVALGLFVLFLLGPGRIGRAQV